MRLVGFTLRIRYFKTQKLQTATCARPKNWLPGLFHFFFLNFLPVAVWVGLKGDKVTPRLIFVSLQGRKVERLTAYGRNGFRYVVVLGQQFPHVILTVWPIEFVRESSYSIWKKLKESGNRILSCTTFRCSAQFRSCLMRRF